MKRNVNVLMNCFIPVLALVTGTFFFCSCSWFPADYLFQEEPKLQRGAVTLETKQTSDRIPLETRLFREMLETETQQNAYDTVAQTALNADIESFTLADTAEADLFIAVKAFLNDYPEVFWLDPMSSYQYYEEDAAVTARLCYLDTGSALQDAKDAFNEALAQLLQEAPAAANDYEMELYLHDRLMNCCEYADGEDLLRHTAYGALVTGEAVCDGYARAFQLLCRQTGIEATVVEGTAGQDDQAETGHMWNCVQPGGMWYHVDVTWDDTDKERACEIEQYFYFNLSEEAVARTHIIGGENHANLFVPECNSSDLNYLQLNTVEISNLEDNTQAVASLIDAARRRQGYCAFRVAEEIDISDLSSGEPGQYLRQWLQGANRFLDEADYISETVRVAVYEKNRVLAIIF